jgi:hypothetical protein
VPASIAPKVASRARFLVVLCISIPFSHLSRVVARHERQSRKGPLEDLISINSGERRHDLATALQMCHENHAGKTLCAAK